MIKTRNLVILGVILVVVAGISYLQKSGHRKETSESAVETIIAADFTQNAPEKITIDYGTEKDVLQLLRTASGWEVETAWNARANQQTIDRLLEELSNLTGEFRSDNESVLQDYGFIDGSILTVHFKAADGTDIAALDLGATPTGGQGTFIRLPGQNKVYLAHKSLLSLLGIYSERSAPQANFFVDLQAIKEDRTSVQSIVLHDGSQTTELVRSYDQMPVGQPGDQSAEQTENSTGEMIIDRNNWQWTVNGKDAQKSVADAVLFASTNIHAVDLAEPAAAGSAKLAEYGLDNPARSASIVWEDGREMVILFGNQLASEEGKPAGYWIQIQGEPSIWVITEHTVNGVFKTLAEFIPE